MTGFWRCGAVSRMVPPRQNLPPGLHSASCATGELLSAKTWQDVRIGFREPSTCQPTPTTIRIPTAFDNWYIAFRGCA